MTGTGRGKPGRWLGRPPSSPPPRSTITHNTPRIPPSPSPTQRLDTKVRQLFVFVGALGVYV